MVAAFPMQPTSFIGREEELAAIQQYLRDPACRVLTLIGPGGVGKTRLAIEVARTIADDFSGGVTFINLQPVQSIDQLVSTIADTLNLSLAGQAEPSQQLFNYLSNKENLLVLDNFEDVSAGAEFVARLLQAAPQVKILITSQRTLNLQEEWLYPVDGMPYPQGDDLDEDGKYSAVHFFVDRAQHVRPDFTLHAEQDGVVRICQLVEGLPLALEMAATWTKTLRCMDIADEIQRDIEFLKSNLRNISPQHRSMQAVFDQSWKRLDADERTVLKFLSVFRGGFDVRAAREVAGASLPVLSALVDKSILRVMPTGRYQIHELIRKCAKKQLEKSPEEMLQAQDRFGWYYIKFIKSFESGLIAGRQKDSLQEVKTEIGNIRKAWAWAIETGNVAAIEQSAMVLSILYQFQCRYVECSRALEEAEAMVKQQPTSRQNDSLLVSILCDQAWLCIRLGKIAEAEQNALESIALIEKHKIRPNLGMGFDPRIPLGMVASIRGDYPEATRLGREVLQESQDRGEIWNEQFSCYLLTSAAFHTGDFESAQHYAEQTYQLARQNQDRWFLAYCLNDLGKVANALGDHTTARGHFKASYQIRKEFADPEGMAVALNSLGEIALKTGDYQEAQRSFQTGRELYQEINDRGGLATSINGLGRVALKQGDFQEAQRCFLAALQISADIQYHVQVMAILVGIAQLLVQVGETRTVSQIVALIDSNENERESVALIQKIARQNKLDIFSSSKENVAIDELITDILVWLPTLELAADQKADPHTPSSMLIDPLTERELEVLQFIADGLTNKQIAETLIITPGTAKWYSSQIYKKLGVKNRTQAAAKARELGIID